MRFYCALQPVRLPKLAVPGTPPGPPPRVDLTGAQPVGRVKYDAYVPKPGHYDERYSVSKPGFRDVAGATPTELAEKDYKPKTLKWWQNPEPEQYNLNPERPKTYTQPPAIRFNPHGTVQLARGNWNPKK